LDHYDVGNGNASDEDRAAVLPHMLTFFAELMTSLQMIIDCAKDACTAVNGDFFGLLTRVSVVSPQSSITSMDLSKSRSYQRALRVMVMVMAMVMVCGRSRQWLVSNLALTAQTLPQPTRNSCL
jgi:hypothetical protein